MYFQNIHTRWHYLPAVIPAIPEDCLFSRIQYLWLHQMANHLPFSVIHHNAYRIIIRLEFNINVGFTGIGVALDDIIGAGGERINILHR